MKLERSHGLSLFAAVAAVAASAAGAFLAGCGATVVNPEYDMPAAEHTSRRMPGSAAKIFTEARGVLDALGFRVTAERPGEALHGVREVGRGHVPIHVWLTILTGDRVYLRFYNLASDEEEEKWKERTYRALEDAIVGTPAQREKRGRPKKEE